MCIRDRGDTVNALLRKTNLNRDGGNNFLSSGPVEIKNIELQYSRALWSGQLAVGLGYDDASNDAVSSDVRGFCLLYTSPSPRDRTRYRMPSSACKKNK